MEVSEWNEDSELKYLTHWMPLPPLPGSAARAPADSVLEDAHALLQEVAACFTCDDDLPDNLLPRIDAVLAARKQGANHD